MRIDILLSYCIHMVVGSGTQPARRAFIACHVQLGPDKPQHT